MTDGLTIAEACRLAQSKYLADHDRLFAAMYQRLPPFKGPVGESLAAAICENHPRFADYYLTRAAALADERDQVANLN